MVLEKVLKLGPICFFSAGKNQLNNLVKRLAEPVDLMNYSKQEISLYLQILNGKL